MFFEKFDELAKAENSSVNAVAKKLNLSSGSVTAWKKGTEPSLSALIKIAQYFNVSTDYLLGLTDEKNIHNGNELKPLNHQESKAVIEQCEEGDMVRDDGTNTPVCVNFREEVKGGLEFDEQTMLSVLHGFRNSVQRRKFIARATELADIMKIEFANELTAEIEAAYSKFVSESKAEFNSRGIGKEQTV